VSCIGSTDETTRHISDQTVPHPPLDFILLDEQSDILAEDLAILLESRRNGPFRDTKIIHIYTPTADGVAGVAAFQSTTPGVTKMTKPPRRARLLQTMAGLKNLPNSLPSAAPATSSVVAAIEDLAAARRTLFGNVLVAEGMLLSARDHSIHYLNSFSDNPVAQNLLIKQLQRYNLTVFATNNGEEAIAGMYRQTFKGSSC
jgi:hypothetical protein